MTKKLPDTSYPWGQMPPPTKEQFSFLAKAHRRRHGSLNAYYFSFEPTGVDAIDEILAAVAHAGRAYHHTESCAWRNRWPWLWRRS